MSGAVCWDLSIMKVDRGSRSFSGGCLVTGRPLRLSRIFSPEDTVSLLLQLSPPVLVSLLQAEDVAATSENLSSEVSFLVLAAVAGFENIKLVGFTPLLFVLTVCIRKVF